MKPIFNRLVSGILSVAVTLSAVPIISAHAEESPEMYPYTLFAASYNEGAITINADNTCVNGNIAANGTIVSSGNFNVNGTKTENADEPMIIIFDKIDNQYFVDTAVDEHEDNYVLEETNIQVNIPTEVQGEALLSGNINITTAFKALDDISLSGDVENTDNSVIFSQYGNIVMDSQNVNLNGLVYAPNGYVDITAQNLNMNSVVIIADSIVINCPNLNANYSSNVAEFVGTTSEKEPDTGKFIILSGNYNDEDETIDMMWFTNTAANSYEIYSSDDGDDYSLVDTIEDTYYQYDITDDFDIKYFKVTATDEEGSVVESDPFSVVSTEDGYSIHMNDNDGDGLQNSLEKIYGTDPENPDTDGDNLTDGFEVLKSHTNPTSIDTDENGVSDNFEDPDEDGLNNHEEQLHETDPRTADTEVDGLNDGDEVNIYGTDPLDPDTDDDGILDVDEVAFKLDPNDPTDADTPIHQVLNSEDLRVNRYNSDFSISIDVEASNNLKRYIKEKVSRYSSILSENRAIIGRPINLKYEAGKIFNGTIKFTLSEKLVNETPSYYPDLDIGIERYGLFIYDEEIGTIVPVSCEYNSDDNSFTVDAKVMGNLMIIDYEALLYDLGIAPDAVKEAMESYAEDFNYDEDEVNVEDDSDNVDDTDLVSGTKFVTKSLLLNSPKLLANEPENSPSGPRQIELVLVIDTTSSMGYQISKIQENLNNLITKLYNNGITQYTAVITYGDIDYNEKTLLNNEENPTIQFYNNPTSIQSVINNITMCWGGDDLETAIDGLGLAESLRYSNNRSKYLFLITDIGSKNKNNYGFSNMSDVAAALNEKGILASIITDSSLFYTYNDLTSITGGTEISQDGDFCDDMYEFITRSTPRASVIVANNLVAGYFKEDLVKGGDCDTDEDGKTDSDEINWKYIKVKNGKNIYPKWSELCKKSGYKGSKNSKFYNALKGIEVIPAFSNPFSRDTDGDGYLDGEDDNPLEEDPYVINDSEINDSEFSNKGKTLTYERTPNAFHTFTLKPKRDSFYVFTNTASSSSNITVTHEEGVLLWEETIYDKPTDDGNYLLEKGVEYTIEIYGYNSSPTGNYSFIVRQDNWQYVKNGAVCNYGISFPVYQNYNSLYLTADGLYEILKNTELKFYGNDLTKSEFQRLLNTSDGTKSNTDILYNNCERWVESLNKAQDKGSSLIKDAVVTNIGNALSISGVILLFPIAPEWVGAAVTVGGGIIGIGSEAGFLMGFKSALQKDAFINALYDGKANICVTDYVCDSVEYDYFNGSVLPTHDEQKFFEPWIERNYIYKFYNGKLCDIEILDIHELSERENGEWVLER